MILNSREGENMKKDRQFKELLELNGKLQELGNELVLSIEKADFENARRFKSMTPHMYLAIKNWKKNIEENYKKITRDETEERK